MENTSNQPSASTWWKTTQKYQGVASNKVSPSSAIILGKHKVDHDYSLGKSLKRADISALIEAYVKSRALPQPENNGGSVVYLVLTYEDVIVEGFFMGYCGFHANINLLPNRQSTRSRMMGKEKKHQQLLPYTCVGNSASQCMWSFHRPVYGPQTPPLVAWALMGISSTLQLFLQEQSPIPSTPTTFKATQLHRLRLCLHAQEYMERGHM